ncbi:uncharacterized protein TNCV_2368431 [Trichonephila clavipes]|nr:uncharacterized protein TNCV_2368431 [Trichonephila clavipes]
MLIYELPASILNCRAQPNVIRRTFEPYNQMLYHRTILEHHKAYPIPLIQKGFHVGDFRKMKKFDQTSYKLPPPTPIHVPAEKRPLEEKSLPFSKRRSTVRITLVMRRVSR